MTSSVDPTAEIAAVLTRLRSLTGQTYEGVEQGTVLPVDAFGKKVPYRDLQIGSVVPVRDQRLIGADEQSQPMSWAFQVAHVAPTRAQVNALGIETDKSLIGWAPTANASPIRTFFFTVYDEFATDGTRVQWITTRFFETILGQNPDFS